MNFALLYLWITLLKRKALRFCSGLRRPTRLMGLAALLSLVGCLYYFRDHEVFEQLTRRQAWIGCALVMLGGSLFKGFLRRGLVFEQADIEFLFTGPFTPRQIALYQMLPNYLFALVQGLVFLGLFERHLNHPLTTAACVIFFQMTCFHLATAMTVFAGSIPEQTHRRIRWLMAGVYFLLTAVYLRVAWNVSVIPATFSVPAVQLLFYPAITPADAWMTPLLQEWARSWTAAGPHIGQLMKATLWLIGFAGGAGASLLLILRLKADVFEVSLGTTIEADERRRRLREGRRIVAFAGAEVRSKRLPKQALFRGVGAIIWKNWVVARRSRRELALAFVCTLIFTMPLAAMLRLHHDLLARGVESDPREETGFHLGIALFLGLLAFLLQRTFPFDFRCDRPHLALFRALPFSPWGLALAELAVPTGLCLGFQALGIAALMVYARLDAVSLWLVALGFPAIALAVNAVWNLHYLLSASARGGNTRSASAAGALMVVALSFLVFFPAGWTATEVFDRSSSLGLGAACFLAVQYSVDFVLVWFLVRLFQRFEISRDDE